MKSVIYKPSPVLLPPEIIKGSKSLTSLLFSYMQDLCYAPESKSLQVYMDNKILRNDGSRINDRSEVRFPNDEEKLELLMQEPIPIYYDVLLVNNKLLAFGPYLPNIEEHIGKPKLFLTNKTNNTRQQVDAFRQDFIPPNKKKVGKKKVSILYSRAISYLVIERLPQELLANPDDWQLDFEYNDFTQPAAIQHNPFKDDANKLTLISLQKNQPAEQVVSWCDHYVTNHKVQRIVLYNNGPISNNQLNNLNLNHKVDLCLVEWNYSFQLRFLSCQEGAFTHANWWLKDVAPHIINFDPDEFLVNDSGIGLTEYLKQKSPYGLRVTGYEVPPNIGLPDKHDSSIRDLAIEQKKANTKYIFSTNHWHTLFNHSARRYTFMINPAYWTLLEHSSRSIIFLLAKYCYKLFFWPSRLLSFGLSMKRPPKQEIYYLHYRSLNTQWKWPKSFFKRLDKKQVK